MSTTLAVVETPRVSEGDRDVDANVPSNGCSAHGHSDHLNLVSPGPDPPSSAAPSKPPSAHALELSDQTNLLPFRRLLPIFLGVALCILVSALDSVIVATGLPTISAVFNAGAIASWVPSAYLLTSTAFQPLYGRFSDIFGRKATLCLAMGVYMVGSLAAGFSRTILQLIVWRGVAGAGGGGIVSLGQIIVSDVVSLRERGKYQGIIGGIIALGFALGPLLGGVLSEKVSWRWCFWITIPLSLFGMCVVVFILPLKPVQGDIKRKLLAVDYLGTILTLTGCTLIILPLIWGGVTFPWSSAIVLATLFSGVFVVGAFCVWEWKGARIPIVPMYVFRHMTVTGVFITMFINGYVFYGSLFYLPQFFQVGLGFSPVRSGVFLFPVLVSQTIASFISGVLVARTGKYRTLINVGFSCLAIGSGCLSSVTAHSPRVVLVVYMLLAGIGAGMTLQTTVVAAQASVDRRDMSVVTVLRNFARLLGGTLSLAIGSTLLNNSLRASLLALALPPSTIARIIASPALLASPSALGITPAQAAYVLAHGYTTGFRLVFSVNAALAVGAVAASVGLIRHKELSRADDEVRKAEARRGEKGRGREGDVEMGAVGRKA